MARHYSLRRHTVTQPGSIHRQGGIPRTRSTGPPDLPRTVLKPLSKTSPSRTALSPGFLGMTRLALATFEHCPHVFKHSGVKSIASGLDLEALCSIRRRQPLRKPQSGLEIPASPPGTSAAYPRSRSNSVHRWQGLDHR